MDATEATLHGTGSRAMVLSPVETTQTRAVVTPACLTASHHVLTMCQQLRSTLHAHQESTHRPAARVHAQRKDTAPPTAATSTRHLALIPSVERTRSSKTW